MPTACHHAKYKANGVSRKSQATSQHTTSSSGRAIHSHVTAATKVQGHGHVLLGAGKPDGLLSTHPAQTQYKDSSCILLSRRTLASATLCALVGASAGETLNFDLNLSRGLA